MNSNIRLQEVVDDAASLGDVAPALATGGMSDGPALSIATDVMQAIINGGPIAQPYNWKWNRFNVDPFPTNSYQQDYFVPGIVNLGWLESCWAMDVNSTSIPKHRQQVEAKKDLEVTHDQTGHPGKICWLPNSQLQTGMWGASPAGPNGVLSQRITETNVTASMTITASRPLGWQVFGVMWGDFSILPILLPPDAVITGIYPVIAATRSAYNSASAYLSYGTQMTPFPGTGLASGWQSGTDIGVAAMRNEVFPSTVFSGASVGTTLSALTGQQMMAKIESSLFADGLDALAVTGAGFAIYYTSIYPRTDSLLPAPFLVPAGQGLAWALPKSVITSLPQQGSNQGTATGGIGTQIALPPRISGSGLQNPGPSVIYTNPIGALSQPLNATTCITDPNGNLWALTTYGQCGYFEPTWPLNPVYPTTANPNVVATTVQDGTCIWTAVNPSGQGFRLNPLPAPHGTVWLLEPVAQKKAPRFKALSQYLEPIPDDFAPHFKQGFFAECFRRHPDAKVRAKYPLERQLFLEALEKAVRQADREMDDVGFYPGSNVMETGVAINPIRPDMPYGPWR